MPMIAYDLGMQLGKSAMVPNRPPISPVELDDLKERIRAAGGNPIDVLLSLGKKPLATEPKPSVWQRWLNQFRAPKL
jgi:NADPH:quinone reductase-like Zn-dependent oxidoreductase